MQKHYIERGKHFYKNLTEDSRIKFWWLLNADFTFIILHAERQVRKKFLFFKYWSLDIDKWFRIYRTEENVKSACASFWIDAELIEENLSEIIKTLDEESKYEHKQNL